MTDVPLPLTPRELLARIDDALAALLRHDLVDWTVFPSRREQRAFLAAAESHGVTCLVSHSLKKDPQGCPEGLLGDLSRLRRERALLETCAQRELIEVLGRLDDARISVLLMKGAPLAYTHYPFPSLRARNDSDLLVGVNDTDRARRVLLDAGYHEADPYPGSSVSHQQLFARRWRDMPCLIDLHWKVSPCPVFRDRLSFGELSEGSRPVAALGPHARTLKPVHALLLACMHRVAHGSESLIWLYDLHLILQGLSQSETEEFIEAAKTKGIWALCADSIALTRSRFRTSVQVVLRHELEEATPGPEVEPSARYVGAKQWRRHLIDFRALSSWRERLQRAADMAFPTRKFMARHYPRSIPFPVLYCWRLGKGLTKALRS